MSVDLHYVAGLIDGEGTVGLEPQSGTRFRGPFVSVPSTSMGIIRWLQAHYPGGVVSTRRSGNDRHADCYVWKLRGSKALVLLTKVWPLLQEENKRERARLLAEEYRPSTVANGRYTETQLAKKLALEERVMMLNSRHGR